MRKMSIALTCSLLVQCAVSAWSRADEQIPGNLVLLPSDGTEGLVGTVTLRPTESPLTPTPARRNGKVKSLASSRIAPALSVETEGPDTIIVGQPASYTVRLSNPDAAVARDVSLRISLPSWVEPKDVQVDVGTVRQEERIAAGIDVVWEVANVPGQSTSLLELDVVPRRGVPFEFSVHMAVRPASSQAQIQIHEAKLALDVTGTEDLVYGQDGYWELTVSNPGTAAVKDVLVEVVADATSLGTVDIDHIPAASERIVDVSLQPNRVGTIQLRARASSRPGLEADTSIDAHVRRAEIVADITGPDFRFAGTSAIYTVRVQNSGDAAAEMATVEVSLPASIRYLGGVERVKEQPAGLSWTIDRLPVGDVKEFQVQCELLAGGDQEVAVVVSTPDELVARNSLVTRVQIAADLQLSVTDPKGPQLVSDTVRYEINVTNRGTGVARQVYVVAVCPPDLEPVDVSGTAAVNAGQIFFRPVAEIRPGQQMKYEVTVRAQEAGSHVFRVVVGCKDPDTRLASEDTTRFYVPPKGPVLADRPEDIIKR